MYKREYKRVVGHGKFSKIAYIPKRMVGRIVFSRIFWPKELGKTVFFNILLDLLHFFEGSEIVSFCALTPDVGGHRHHGADEREDDQEPGGKRCKTTEFAFLPPNLGNDAWK